MSDTDIINTISSSDELRMNKAYQIKETQSLIGEKNLLANLYLNPLHLACSSPIIMKSYQMDTFAPKEVSSLRRKLGPFDAAKMNPSALYPNRDQTICNLMRKEPKQGRFVLFRRCKTIAPYRGLIILYSVFNRAITLILT